MLNTEHIGIEAKVSETKNRARIENHQAWENGKAKKKKNIRTKYIEKDERDEKQDNESPDPTSSQSFSTTPSPNLVESFVRLYINSFFFSFVRDFSGSMFS